LILEIRPTRGQLPAILTLQVRKRFVVASNTIAPIIENDIDILKEATEIVPFGWLRKSCATSAAPTSTTAATFSFQLLLLLLLLLLHLMLWSASRLRFRLLLRSNDGHVLPPDVIENSTYHRCRVNTQQASIRFDFRPDHEPPILVPAEGRAVEAAILRKGLEVPGGVGQFQDG